MQINNPMFSAIDKDQSIENSATMSGVVIKTTILLAITFFTALSIMILNIYSPTLLMVSSILGLVMFFIGRMNPNAAAISGIVYAGCEGILLGTMSGILSSIEGFEGAVPIAIVATLAIFCSMLFLYSIKVVRVTSTLMKVMLASGLAIFIFMFLSMILSFFGNTYIYDAIYNNIGFAALLSLLFIAYGAFMLVFNFNEAQSYVENGFDKKFEWCAALGLIISIIYIYIQVLRFVILILGNKKR